MYTQEQKIAQIEIIDYLLNNLCTCEICMKGRSYLIKEKNRIKRESNIKQQLIPQATKSKVRLQDERK